MSKKQKIEIVKDEADPIPTKLFQREMLRMATELKIALNSGVKAETIAVLLKDKTGISKANIHRVINALQTLKADWLV